MPRLHTAGRVVRVAAGQMVAQTIDHAADAWPAIQRLVERAAGEQAELLVLPECAYPAYWLVAAQRYRREDILRTSAVIERLCGLAARFRLHVVCGIVEERDGRLYNSAAVIDAAGQLVGIARKTFLWDCDNRWFTPGDEIGVFDTALGRLGVLICADARAPETTATLAAKGAELLAMPTAWVNVSKRPGELYNVQPDFLIEARAREFGLPFVCADKAGTELPLEYVGQSLIVASDGRVQRRGPVQGEALAVDDVALGEARRCTATAEQRARLLVPATTGGCVAGASASDGARVRLAIRGGEFEVGPARAARVDGSALASFVAARCLALDGVQVICAADAADDVATLRARAAENRMFVMATMQGGASVIIGPEGGIRARGDTGAAAEVDLVEADLKRFTPETDLWGQRRTSAYVL